MMNKQQRNDGIPSLYYNEEWDRWELRIYNERDGFNSPTYGMFVRYAHHTDENGEGVWSDVRFFVEREGIYFELVDEKEYSKRYRAFVVDEGKAIADLWFGDQQSMEVVAACHPVYQLRKHWEAMMTLKLFNPKVTLSDWKEFGLPLSKECQAQIARLRAIKDKDDDHLLIASENGHRFVVQHDLFMRDENSYIVLDLSDDCVCLSTDSKMSAIMEAQKLNGFDCVDGLEATYNSQIGVRKQGTSELEEGTLFERAVGDRSEC